MADMADKSDKAQKILLSAAIENARAKAAKMEAEPSGVCLYCSERVEHPRRWCDADCRDGWEIEQERRRV